MVARLGTEAPRAYDHERRSLPSRQARDVELRRELGARLGGLEHEVTFDDDGFVSALTVIDPCVGPRPEGPVGRVDADDVALAAAIIARVPDLFGVPVGAPLELVCNMGHGTDLTADVHWPGAWDGDHPPIASCVTVSPTSPFGGRIVVQRSSNVEAHCRPGLVISGHGWPAPPPPPPITIDLAAWSASLVGRTISHPGAPSGRFCFPVLPRPGEAPPGDHCQSVPGTPAQSTVVRAVSFFESRALSWDRDASRYVVARRLVANDVASGAVLEDKWDPAPRGPVVVESSATPITQ